MGSSKADIIPEFARPFSETHCTALRIPPPAPDLFKKQQLLQRTSRRRRLNSFHCPSLAKSGTVGLRKAVVEEGVAFVTGNSSYRLLWDSILEAAAAAAEISGRCSLCYRRKKEEDTGIDIFTRGLFRVRGAAASRFANSFRRYSVSSSSALPAKEVHSIHCLISASQSASPFLPGLTALQRFLLMRK